MNQADLKQAFDTGSPEELRSTVEALAVECAEAEWLGIVVDMRGYAAGCIPRKVEVDTLIRDCEKIRLRWLASNGAASDDILSQSDPFADQSVSVQYLDGNTDTFNPIDFELGAEWVSIRVSPSITTYVHTSCVRKITKEQS